MPGPSRAALWAWLLLVALNLSSCTSGHPEGQARANGQEPGRLELRPVGDALWFEHNGLPYPNGDTGTSDVPLDGPWRFQEDPEDKGLLQGWQTAEWDISTWRIAQVPGVWNALFDDLFHYEGVGWYGIDVPTPESPRRPVLSFGAVFLSCDVFVNGTLVGSHHGGYTPFWVDCSRAWRAGVNRITLRVSNLITAKTIPVDTYTNPGLHGWWPYGGISRDVVLEDWPDAMAFRLDARYELDEDLSGAALDFLVGIKRFGPRGEAVVVEVDIDDPHGRTVLTGTSETVRLAESEVCHIAATGRLRPVELWDIRMPNVYSVVIRLRDARGTLIQEARHATGFRRFEIRDGTFYLNGRRHVLRGINRHDDVPGRGSALTEDDAAEDLDLIQELGADHVRPGHYPAHPSILSGCRDRGITVTEEVPVYQLAFDQLRDPELRPLIRDQLIEMIERDRNNPAVILWSVSNETWSFLPGGAELGAFEIDVVRQWDPTRYVTAAILNSGCFVPDGLGRLTDVFSLNEYFGWYIGRPHDIENCLTFVSLLYGQKPIVLSEFGADALLGRHADPDAVGPEPLDDHSYCEEFQAWLLDVHLSAAHKAHIDGTMPWVLHDFHMEWNPSTGKPHPVPWMNLKGLASYDHRPKKGFETVQSFYKNPWFLTGP